MIIFAGVHTKHITDYKNILELCYEGDDYIYFRTKKVYTYEDKQMCFDYRYVVCCLLLDEHDDCDINHVMAITMAVEPEHVNFEVLYSTAFAYGLEETDYMPNCVDIVRESATPMIFLDEGISLEFQPWFEQDIFVNKINAASAIIETIDAQRTFYLDKVWNRMGTTGWDSLRYYLYGNCPITASLLKSKACITSNINLHRR